ADDEPPEPAPGPELVQECLSGRHEPGRAAGPCSTPFGAGSRSLLAGRLARRPPEEVVALRVGGQLRQAGQRRAEGDVQPGPVSISRRASVMARTTGAAPAKTPSRSFARRRTLAGTARCRARRWAPVARDR